MATIRSEVSFRPINGEKVAKDLTIWRFNFGWIKKTRNVGTSAGVGNSSGTLVETATVGVQGDPLMYSEESYMEGLPASIECPGSLTPNGTCVLDSYSKTGSINRVSPMINLSGEAPLMYSMGTVPYGVIEQKGYDAQVCKNPGGSSGIPNGIVVDMVRTEANGVSTVTIASG